MRSEAAGGSSSRLGRHGRRSTYNFEPNVKIQLVKTSDGSSLGGIRLSTLRPMVHRKQPWHAECNKARCTRPHLAEGVPCRKKACLVEGYNQVDKLEKGLALFTRALN